MGMRESVRCTVWGRHDLRIPFGDCYRVDGNRHAHTFSRGRAVIVIVVVATQLQFLQQRKGNEWE